MAQPPQPAGSALRHVMAFSVSGSHFALLPLSLLSTPTLKADNNVADSCLRSNSLRSLWTHCLRMWCEIPVSKTQEGCPGLDQGRGGRQMVAEVCDGGRKGGGDVEVRCLF